MSAILFKQINEIHRILKLEFIPTLHHNISLKQKENQLLEKRFSDHIALSSQLESLKIYIQDIVKRLNFLENQNKVLKRIVSRSNQQVSEYLHHSGESFQSNFQNQLTEVKYLSPLQNSNNFTELRNSCQKSSKVSVIKRQLADLQSNLKSMTKFYEKYQQEQHKNDQKKDVFLNQDDQNFLESKYSKQFQNKGNEVDLQQLLCHEDLSFEDIVSKQKVKLQKTTDSQMYGSLIAKGIKYRQTTTLRSKEFQSLKNMIEKYRSGFKNIQDTIRAKGNIISKYR